MATLLEMLAVTTLNVSTLGSINCDITVLDAPVAVHGVIGEAKCGLISSLIRLALSVMCS